MTNLDKYSTKQIELWVKEAAEQAGRCAPKSAARRTALARLRRLEQKLQARKFQEQ
jgi:hypothetical protein